MIRVLRGEMTRSFPVLIGLLALGCGPSAPSPASPATAPPAWTLSLSMDSPAERCDLAKGDGALRWRCGQAALAPVRADTSEIVKLVESTDWAAEAAKSEPPEAGPTKRSFRYQAGDGAIEVLRYPSTTTSLGQLGAAFDALIAAERRSPSDPPTPVRGPREFPAVPDRGLVTIQDMSLQGPPSVSTLRVGADGAWSWTTTETKTGKLDATQLAAVRELLAEAASAKPSTKPGQPCDAIPSSSSRVLFDKDRETGWSGPCAGPPPPEVFAVLHRYLRQAAEGRPAAELEQTLRSRQPH